MLSKKIQDESIIALKTGDKDKLSILRLILSQIKNQEIEKKELLKDEEVIFVIKKIAKELKESIDAFTKGKRPDLIEESKKQLDIVSLYLPKEIDDQELLKEIEAVITANKAVFEQNPKAIIGLCMGKLKTKADPARIMKLLQTKLQSL